MAGELPFNEAARQFSIDKAGKCGLLGWKTRGELDPVFVPLCRVCSCARGGIWARVPPSAHERCLVLEQRAHVHAGSASTCEVAVLHTAESHQIAHPWPLAPQDFWNAALKVPEGHYTEEPVRTNWGYHIIKIEGRK
jgi:hypothetical protein